MNINPTELPDGFKHSNQPVMYICPTYIYIINHFNKKYHKMIFNYIWHENELRKINTSEKGVFKVPKLT